MLKKDLKKPSIPVIFILILFVGYRPSFAWTEAVFDTMLSKIPRNIILTWSEQPTTTQSVTWQTDTSVTVSFAEIAAVDASPNFTKTSKRFKARIETMRELKHPVNYHSVTFKELQPDQLYFYRVGSENNWSEWFQFRTAAATAEPFEFIYLGDGQNNVLSMWSHIFRSAFMTASDARFVINAGDLVTHADSHILYTEWFEAGRCINTAIPTIPIPGNHDYFHPGQKERYLTKFWQPQFTLPENGIKELPESNYYIDFQGMRILALNSNEHIPEQTLWLESVLKDNPNRWTIATFHHPIFSSTRNRDEKLVRESWKPIFDQYRVDLVLVGHDHTYARGRAPEDKQTEFPYGPVYVVSVSGPKMYTLTDNRWMDRAAENTQLYQIISINQDTLSFKAFTAARELYDAFKIVKNGTGKKQFIDEAPKNIPERTYENTLLQE
jgi:predicted phosphodiesterase